MSAAVDTESKSYYEQLIETQWDSITEPNINLHALRNYISKSIPFYSSALQLVDVVIDNTDKAKTWPSFAFTNGHCIFLSTKLYEIHGMVVTKDSKPWFATPELGVMFTILHEIGHLVFDSFGRISHREPRLWNVASDYQINQFVARIMKESQIFKNDIGYTRFMEVLNKNFLLDPAKYSKLSAEATYDDLYKHGMRGGEHGGWSLNGDMQGDGSGTDDDGKPLSSEDQMTRDIIKQELKDYGTKNASKLPGSGSSYGRDFEMLLEPPKVNLRQVLKHITDRENTEDYGYSRRGSRMDHLVPGNIRLPSIIESNPDKIRKVMIVLDCSGSMSSEQLNDYLNIIREVTNKHTKNPLWLILHTDQLCFSGDIKDYSEVPTNITGGTAFRPVIDEIARLNKEKHIVPSVVIWGTDLYGELAQDDYNIHTFPYHKKLHWIISGSDLDAPLGHNWHIDEIGC